MGIFIYASVVTTSFVLLPILLFFVSKRIRSYVQSIVCKKLNSYADERIDKFEKKMRVEIGEVNGKIEIISGRIDGIQDKLNDLE